jgi:hypothetical protein
MTWLAEYNTHRSSSRGLAPGFRKSFASFFSNGLTADFSLIYVKLYAGRGLKIFI